MSKSIGWDHAGQHAGLSHCQFQLFINVNLFHSTLASFEFFLVSQLKHQNILLKLQILRKR